MFIGWSYTRFLFLALIGNPTWLPGPIMCSDWLKFKNSSCLYDHPMNISAKFDSNLFCGFGKKAGSEKFPYCPVLK
jgi:hypothetical protein